LPAPLIQPKSKLTIISAYYGVDGGPDADVAEEYLRPRIRGDSLVGWVGADLFGGFQPVIGLLKRLKIRYSFNGEEGTVTRPEHAMLVLPEDAFLKKQINELNLISAILSPLQIRLLELAKRLRKMLYEIPAPKPLNHAATSEETTAWIVQQSEWDQKIRYRYEGEFSSKVGQLESLIGKDDLPLARCLSEFNARSGRVMHSKDIEALIETLWDMARFMDGRGL
jgi:hypothetical protein